jgi:hypothetical protein
MTPCDFNYLFIYLHNFNAPFPPLSSHTVIKYENYILPVFFKREGGRVPRTLEVELTEDLVESCTPGDEVTVTGIVKVRIIIVYSALT